MRLKEKIWRNLPIVELYYLGVEVDQKYKGRTEKADLEEVLYDFRRAVVKGVKSGIILTAIALLIPLAYSADAREKFVDGLRDLPEKASEYMDRRQKETKLKLILRSD